VWYLDVAFSDQRADSITNLHLSGDPCAIITFPDEIFELDCGSAIQSGQVLNNALPIICKVTEFDNLAKATTPGVGRLEVPI
jgi:hypothetical protein